MRSAVVDTGAWLALRNSDDQLHERATAHYATLTGVRLVTTSDVVDETATRLRYDLGLTHALAFRDLVRDVERAGRLRLVWVDRKLTESAWAIIEQYADVALSLTDATTIAVARSRRIDEIFAFDDDFEAAGLHVLPK